jgi:hypothetical protein
MARGKLTKHEFEITLTLNEKEAMSLVRLLGPTSDFSAPGFVSEDIYCALCDALEEAYPSSTGPYLGSQFQPVVFSNDELRAIFNLKEGQNG